MTPAACRRAVAAGLCALLAASGCTGPGQDAPTPPALSPSAIAASPSTVLTGAFLFFEDFERGAARWAVAATDAVGWRLLKAPACGGLFTMLLGKPDETPFVPTDGDHALRLEQAVDLGAAKAPRLRFDVKGRASPPEALAMQAEARRPGGSWEPVGEAVHARYVLANTMVRDLTPWAGGLIELRFRVRTSPTEASTKGLYLDDVQIIEPDAP